MVVHGRKKLTIIEKLLGARFNSIMRETGKILQFFGIEIQNKVFTK